MEAIKETVDMPTVEDKDGESHPLGLNTNKEKLYDKDDNQITKSCHICQGQHIYWSCGKGCRASYCARCVHYSGMTVEEAISKGCPKCQDICVCKKCLRRRNLGRLTNIPLPERAECLAAIGNSGEGLPPVRQSTRPATVQQGRPKKKRGRPRKRPAGEIAEAKEEEEGALAEEGKNAVASKGTFFQAAIKSLESQTCHDLDDVEPAGAEASKMPQATQNRAVNGDNRMPDTNDAINGDDGHADRKPAPIITAPVGEGGVVLGQGGAVYAVGQPLGKKRVLDENGMQISKSCHQCQDQHITFTCKTGKEGCKASYCRRCCDKYYIGIAYEDIMEKCPRCRGFCNCRGCLRVQFNPTVPQRSEKMSKTLAEHVLKCTGGLIKEVLASFDKELADADAGMKLEDVEVEPTGTRRINCDRCSTSIPDLFKSCENCAFDFCINCCGEVREIFGGSNCPTCTSPLKIRRQLKPEILEDLRSIIKEYGDCKVTASGPFWSKNPSDDTTAPASCEGSNQVHWSKRVDRSMLRVCSTHPDPEKKYIFCPTSADLENSNEAHQVFQECMRRGEPVIVRNVKGVMDWRPETMCRAVVEKGNKFYGVAAKVTDVTVIDCTQCWGEFQLPQKAFFQDYQSEEVPKAMLKVKDWPPEEHFRDRLKRHNQDFMEMLPMKEYTNPTWGSLNMYRALPDNCLPPDLGPKTYIALGRKQEHPGEGDSVTKLHVDMSDAMNVLLNAYSRPEEDTEEKVRLGDDLWEAPSYGNAGAVWDLVRREDVPLVSEYLKMLQNEFIHNGLPVRKHGVINPILEQMFQLRSQDRAALAANHGVHLWHVEQHVNEAVYIPAGVPHQVRNLKSCIKVAVDFVPPESAGQIFHLAKKLRGLASVDRDAGLDKLQGVAMMFFAAREAYQILSGELTSIAMKTHPAPKKTNRRGAKRRKTSEERDLELTDPETDEVVDQ
ncbi:hypothetical protein BSKO_08709 [Bryopsis sp. KO-2023]|nr:hypothetical protein BSKO_08709 [Bryopsis sp. KO-2023]